MTENVETRLSLFKRAEQVNGNVPVNEQEFLIRFTMISKKKVEYELCWPRKSLGRAIGKEKKTKVLFD